MLCAAAVLVAVGGVTVAVKADDGPIDARQKIMKANGTAAKLGADMAKGVAPFDLDKAKGIFDTFADASVKMPELFPDTSKTGGDTTASPKIWDDMASFKAGFAKFGKDAGEQKATVKDLDTFKAAFGTMAKDCGSCHDAWRVKKG
jgi:cytochrome c556